MTGASTSGDMSPKLLKVAERAQRDRDGQFHALAHLIDVRALERSYRRLRARAAVGVDGVSKEQYGRELESNLRALHDRLKSKRYRHQPLRRVHIPKEKGKTREISIATVEDKIVQGALSEVLGTVYEQTFLDCSYGFRPRRSAHDALRALNKIAYRGDVNWVLDTDISSFFDSVDRKRLLEMIQRRVPDGSIQRLVGKCLNAGILEGAMFSCPDRGVPQGSALSPLLGNIYLHYVLDDWFEREVKPRLRGRATLIRYADDLVIAFEVKSDAERVWVALGKRLGRYGLALHSEKTRLMRFRRPPKSQDGGKGPGTFDFLGFTVFWRRTKRGAWVPGFKTRRARLRRAIVAVNEWCRRHRHHSVQEQHAALSRRLRGHFNYFGVNGNGRSLRTLLFHAKRAWFKWLCRRSQRGRLSWERFRGLLRDHPLPPARIAVQIWG